MPRTAAETVGSTTSTGGRLTVSLPKEVAADLEKLKDHFEAEFEALHNIRIPLKPEQVIHAALKRLSASISDAESTVVTDVEHVESDIAGKPAK